ncbi:MAG: hypothetical protein AB1418_02415 [Pseudomonadota bacterium]
MKVIEKMGSFNVNNMAYWCMRTSCGAARRIRYGFSLFLLVLLWAGSSTAGGVRTQPGEIYPDTWYRLYEWPIHVCDMFFSDRKIWGNEPVLILCNGDKSEAIAEGFFSKKRRTVRRTSIGAERLYLYWPSKTVMATKRTYKLNDSPTNLRSGDGGRLEVRQERIEMYWGPNETKSKFDLIDRISSFPLIWSPGCEPMQASLRRFDPKGKLLWEKTTTRYYRKGEVPPPNYFLNAGNPGCGGYEAWLSVGADPYLTLRLADDSVLTTSAQATYVIRINSTNGMSKPLPPNLAVLDMEAVIAAKREMVSRYLKSIRVAEESARDGAEFLRRYSELSNPEKVYRDLASYFFSEELNGDRK